MKVKNSNIIPIEIWGGIECTVNRVQDRYNDQLLKSGHCTRIEDLELIAAIGFKTIRYPVLWEKIQPEKDMKPDWSWTDERLLKLRSLGIKPVAGLLHHGSGPAFTNLLDPQFPELFAEFSLQVALRYPWLEYFTPINEPLTTARFSALYGHWYPHLKDNLSFSKALINQILAIKKAMEAIRQVIPEAKLVQTEDLGKTFSTKVLSYQAKFENERRWLTFDLLGGKVGPGHRMWDYFLWAGIEARELEEIQKKPCPPDIIGINHYLSSERYLDNRTSLYPHHLRGGNGKHRYADVEAVRLGPLKPAGFYNLLKETCQRYPEIPVALTEVHLGGTREEQLRWFYQAWKAANDLNTQGYLVKAITSWAMLGLFDWNSLVREEKNHYECGLFDVRGKIPRPTALAHLTENLIKAGKSSSSLITLPGWWDRAERIIWIQPKKEISDQPVDYSTIEDTPPVLITGASGTLGKAFARICQVRGIPYRLLSRQEMDITQDDKIEMIISKFKPWAIINAAGYVKVDEAENEPIKCFRENTEGPVNLAKICSHRNIKFLTFSSDLVFNGKQKKPYLEDHTLAPLSIYGLSKQKAELQVIEQFSKALIIRTSAFFGPWDEYNFLIQSIRSIERKELFFAPKDQCISPTYVPDLVNTCLDLIIDGEYGIWNISNPSEISWADFAIRSAEIAGLDSSYIIPSISKNMNFVAKRPRYSALSSKRGILLPSLEEAILRFQGEKVAV